MSKTAYCFDLDGTLTKQEALPLISRQLGLHEEIDLLTELTMDGLIPFSTSFKLRVKLLSSIPISKVRSLVAQMELHEEVVGFIRDHSRDCFIVTGNIDVWVRELVDRIGCKAMTSEAEFEGENLLGVRKILDKAVATRQIRSRYQTVVAVGDGMNDLPMLEEADVKIAFGASRLPVEGLIKASDYLVYHERSLCDLLRQFT